MPAAHGVGQGAVGKVKRHQRNERAALGNGGLYLFFVCQCLFHGNNGRFQVGHNQCAGELAGSMGDDGLHGRTVAEMDVKIVGTGDGEGLHGSFRCVFVFRLPAVICGG